MAASPALRKLAAEMANILRRDGWCQFIRHDHKGRHCILGAFEDAYLTKGPDIDPWLRNSLRREITERTGYMTIPGFNDESGRTADEVINLLDSIAEEKR